MSRPPVNDPIVVDGPGDLDAAAVVAVAQGAHLELSPALLDRVRVAREQTLTALTRHESVYGVSTGMGAQSDVAVATSDRPAYQGELMLARAVGGPPWLARRELRAVLAARVRTLLEPEAGVSAELLRALVAALAEEVVPEVPASGSGAAGEIIPLAHLGGHLVANGYVFGPKEGVAFLQGAPCAAGLAALVSADARVLAAQALSAAAGEIALVRAPRDPYHPALARGDDALRVVLDALHALVGAEEQPRMLQAPVSFRVVAPALAAVLRAVRRLDAAVDRALTGVSTSPALVDGRFLGTAGFDGFDLAWHLDALRVAVLHLAELGTARLHRMLDPRVTGLAPQLSPEPGRQAGVVALHKRAVGLVHDVRRAAAPASLGAAETSLGQEDVQSFTVEAAGAAGSAVDVLRDVVACELVALHQASRLAVDGPFGSPDLNLVLRKAFERLPETTTDRPFGREVTAVLGVLRLGWAANAL